MLPDVFNHLWQSTVFAAVAGLLTLALRRNRAQVRYGIWLAASVKFWVPFSVLIDLGSYFGRHAPVAVSTSDLSIAIEQVSAPFAVSSPVMTSPSFTTWIPAVLSVLWAVGFVTLVCSWYLRWRRMRALLRVASPVPLEAGVPVLTSPSFGEPGVFGVWHPVLLLPEGITDRLTPAQFAAILTHELCHVRRRDNMAGSIHMTVEAVFWFHPLVWWLGARLMEERERACDEEVLVEGSEPQAYAEGILKICEMHLESALECVAGVTGGNLKRRIEAIMTNRTAVRLNVLRRAVLALAGATALTGPVIFGLASASQNRPQEKTSLANASAVVFEVASVRPSDRRGGDSAGFKTGERTARDTGFEVEHNRFTAANVNLFALIVKAYGLTACRALGGTTCGLLAGGPDWLRKDGFDIEAKMPEASSDYTLAQFQNGRALQLQLMLQALLADRFRLTVHRERKQLPVYSLTVGRKGPRLRKADESEESRIAFKPSVQASGQGTIQLFSQNGSLQELAELLSKFMDRPVLDQTGLAGRFDFTADYDVNTDAPGPFTGATGPGMFSAFQDQLGLKLTATKGLVEVLVIDHAERPRED